MERIINLFNQDENIYGDAYLESIVRLLATIFNVKIDGIEFTDDKANPTFGYNFINRRVIINFVKGYEDAIRMHKISKYGDSVSILQFYKYRFFFGLLHEMNHAKQDQSEDINKTLKSIYKECFNYVQSRGGEDYISRLNRLNRAIIYSNSHDLFISEVNADLEAYLTLERIISNSRITGKNELLEYLNKHFYNRFLKSYELKGEDLISLPEECFYRTIKTSEELLDLSSLSMREKIMNGLSIPPNYLDNIKSSRDIKRLTVNKK